MGIRERRKRHDDRLRRRILDVAERLFVEEGFTNASMRKIAAEIEYAPTTIYRLFANKAEIMSELIARGYRGVRERYREVLERGAGDEPFTVLSDLVRAYVEFALENPRHYELWFATGSMDVADGTLRLRHGDLSFTVYQPWLEQIESSRVDGGFAGRSSMEVFQLLWPVVHGLISLRIRHPDMTWMPLSEQLGAAMDMVIRGLDRPRETPEAIR